MDLCICCRLPPLLSAGETEVGEGLQGPVKEARVLCVRDPGGAFEVSAPDARGAVVVCESAGRCVDSQRCVLGLLSRGVCIQRETRFVYCWEGETG